MIETGTAKQIGQRLGIIAGIIGLLIAYSMFITLYYVTGSKLSSALIWITKIEFIPNISIGAIGLIIMSYFFGKLAGIDILIKKKNHIWTGIKYGVLILVTGTLIGSTVGFIEEGIDNIGSFDNPFYDYLIKPVYWVTIAGIIPVTMVGIWFGWSIKKQGAKQTP